MLAPPDATLGAHTQTARRAPGQALCWQCCAQSRVGHRSATARTDWDPSCSPGSCPPSCALCAHTAQATFHTVYHRPYHSNRCILPPGLHCIVSWDL